MAPRWRCVVTPLDAERAVLGALLTGALRHADVVDAPDGLCGHLRHRRICDVLLSILDVREVKAPRVDAHWVKFAMIGAVPLVPKARTWTGKRTVGIDWRFAERTCKAAKVWPLAVVSIEPPQLCGLLELARTAPRRRGALGALNLVVADARARADAKGERARLREAARELVTDLVGGYLSTALGDAVTGGYACVRYGRGREAWASADVVRSELALLGNM